SLHDFFQRYVAGTEELPYVGKSSRLFIQPETGGREEFVVGQFFGSCNVALKEVMQAGSGEHLGRSTYTLRFRKELTLLRVLLIHAVEEIAQGLLSLRVLTDSKIEQHAQDFTLIVVVDAALWCPI